MTRNPEPLREHARALYPADPYLQREWLRAIEIVRTTARGWGLDVPVMRAAPEPYPEPTGEQ